MFINLSEFVNNILRFFTFKEKFTLCILDFAILLKNHFQNEMTKSFINFKQADDCYVIKNIHQDGVHHI